MKRNLNAKEIAARKKAREIENGVLYGSLRLVEISAASDEEGNA